MANPGSLEMLFPEPMRPSLPGVLKRPVPLAKNLSKTRRALQTAALTDPLRFAAGLSLCVAVLLASAHFLEKLGAGPRPIWDLAVTTEVTCKEGRAELPSFATLHATLPAKTLKASQSAGKGRLPGARGPVRRLNFELAQGVSWGRDGTLFLQARAKGAKHPVGQIELRKIRCMQPLELEALGLKQQPSFEVTLPLWMDPVNPVSLVRNPQFSCVRGDEHERETGLLRSAHAAEEPLRPASSNALSSALLHVSAFSWTRATTDQLQFGRGSRALKVRGTNYDRYSSWLTCRMGEDEGSEPAESLN